MIEDLVKRTPFSMEEITVQYVNELQALDWKQVAMTRICCSSPPEGSWYAGSSGDNETVEDASKRSDILRLDTLGVFTGFAYSFAVLPEYPWSAESQAFSSSLVFRR